jgi:hypothetical protein
MELRSLKELRHRRKKLMKSIARGLCGHEIPAVAEMEAFMLEEQRRELLDVEGEIRERFAVEPESTEPSPEYGGEEQLRSE